MPSDSQPAETQPSAADPDVVLVVVQEGGSSGELYVHTFDDQDSAVQYRVDCEDDGAYRTSTPIPFPRAMANMPGFQEALQELVRASHDVDFPESSDDRIGLAGG